MFQVSKGGWALLAFIVGALVGASMPSQINTLKSEVRAFAGTLATTAGRGSQDVGGFVAE